MRTYFPNNASRALTGFTAAVLLTTLAGSSALAQQARIINRPLTPDDVIAFKLPEATPVSQGLMTVGVGSSVYLEAQVLKGTAVAGITWKIDTKPTASSAGLTAGPLGAEIPSYEPSDREEFSVAGRQLFIPDVKGQYTISATVATGGTNLVLKGLVTAANYVGSGFVDGKNIATGRQCGSCHDGGLTPDKMTSWSKTGHATFFTEAIDGIKSSHYGSNCISCHTLGYDLAITAVNGGFDDVAKQLNWSFPTVLTNGNWAALPMALKQVSNIQCESCHGPGSEHGGKTSATSVSFSAGSCAACHSEEPYHFKPEEWINSRHAVAVREESASCAGCHSGIGFIDRISGATVRTNYAAITCATCHDPHDAANPHQLRNPGVVKLLDTSRPGGATVITNAGTGAMCMQCHMSRRDAVTYVVNTAANNRFGPHHGPQADMLAGVNAITYGKVIPSSGHSTLVTNTCVACHMQTVATKDPAFTHAGGHTFNMAYEDGTNAPIELVGACKTCHGAGVTTFDMARVDYDGDGTVEGVQTEVKGLISQLSKLLPPLGKEKLTLSEITSSVTTNYTAAQKKALYNLLFVVEDGSYGIHNTAYAVGLLKSSLADLNPGGGTGTGVGTSVTEINAAIAKYFASSTNIVSNPVSLGKGTFQIGIDNLIGWNLGVQASSDLVTWTNLPTGALPVYQFADPDATNAQKRFYRLRFP